MPGLDYELEDHRAEDWERAKRKMEAHIKLLLFYSFTFTFGTVIAVAATVWLIQSRVAWGHSLAMIIGGLFLVALSPMGYFNDSWGIRDGER